MAFHTLAEFVATILIMLIGSGSVIESRLGAMDRALGSADR